MTLSVSIIIPNWNGRDLLEKNLPHVLAAKDNPKNKILEVIIVDDKSDDDSVAYLQKNYPEKIKIIRHSKNRGFSSAVNTGVRSAKGQLVVLLNSDVSPEKDFLVSLLRLFSDQDVFAVSMHEPGHSYAKGFFKDGYIMHYPAKETDSVAETFWVSGGSGAYRRDIWILLGGMDEKLLSPLYWEDVDLGYRALKRGYKLLWDPKAIVHHQHESTTKKLPKKYVQRIQERNQLLFIWKNLTSMNLFRKHLLGLMQRILKGPGYLVILFMALSKLDAVIKARAKGKKEAKISDEAIFAKYQ
jgi:GT2 family glycosyltransferase